LQEEASAGDADRLVTTVDRGDGHALEHVPVRHWKQGHSEFDIHMVPSSMAPREDLPAKGTGRDHCGINRDDVACIHPTMMRH